MRGARDTKRYTRPVPCNASAKLRREFLLTPMVRSNSEERRMLSIKTYLGTAAIAAMVMVAGASSANAWTRAGGGSGRAAAGRPAVRAAAPAGPATTQFVYRRARQHHHQHRLDHLRRRLLHAYRHDDGSLWRHRQPQQHRHAVEHDPEKCVAVSLATNATRLRGDHAQTRI